MYDIAVWRFDGTIAISIFNLNIIFTLFGCEQQNTEHLGSCALNSEAY